MDLGTLGKYLALAGIALALLGGLMVLGSKLGLGSLPGDLRIERENVSCYVPIATSILLSLLLTLLLNLLLRWFK